MSATILLVDDDNNVRPLLAKILRRHGYVVLEADGGQAALEVFQQGPDAIQLVVTDVRMPHMSGPTLVECLRAVSPTIPVLYTSGHAQETLELGARTVFLAKPFDALTLVQQVDALMTAPPSGATTEYVS